MSAEDLKPIVLAAYQGFQTGNLEPVLGILAEDIEWINHENSPLGGTFRGKEAILQYIQKSYQQTELIKYELETLMAEGNKIVGIVKISYKVKATGKIHSGKEAHLITVRENQIIRVEEIGNSAAEAWGEI